MDNQKVIAAINVAMGLVKSGYEIYEMIKNNENLSEKDFLDVIDRENAEQEAAKQRLKELLKNEK